MKEIRERAGLSMEKLARLAGYSAASGLQRYENASYSDDYFPLRLVRKLAPHLVNRGNPVITRDEVFRDLAGTPDPDATTVPIGAFPGPTSLRDRLALVSDVEIYRSQAGRFLVKLLGPNDFQLDLPLPAAVAQKLGRELVALTKTKK